MTDKEMSDLVADTTITILRNVPALAAMTVTEYRYYIACVGLSLTQYVINAHEQHSHALKAYLEIVLANIAIRIPDQGVTLEYKLTDLRNPANSPTYPLTKEEVIQQIRKSIDPS